MIASPDAAILRVAEALREAAVEHLVVGAISSNYHGISRATKDMDLVLQCAPAELDRLIHLLADDFDIDPQPSFETITGTFRDILHAKAFPFDVELFRLSSDAHDQERFRRRIAVEYPALGGSVFIPTAEDVIITKLRWARGKDIEDVRDVIAVQGDAALDWEYIHRWTEIHGTRARLDAIRASIPPID